MNTTTRHRACTGRSRRAFTLIELLVVIAIMALLAGMIFPVTAIVNKQKIRSKARAELTQMESMIENYKAKLGHYPPTVANRPYQTNTLFYELSGTTFEVLGAGNLQFETLDRSATIGSADLQLTFGTPRLVNTMQGKGTDEGRSSERFTVNLKPHQTAPLVEGDLAGPRVFVCTVGWKNIANPLLPLNPTKNPFFYNSLNPTNNPNSFDLWVDVIIGDKTNRISNWSKEPLIP